MDKILFYDMHNAIWRAYVGFKDEKYSEENVIIFNFFRNLRPLVEMFKPDKMFCVWEGSPKFRYELYSDYKANRIKTASRITHQELFQKVKPKIKDILFNFPITFARAEEYEADDVIATLCEQLKEEDLTIISSDSDFIQLLQKGYNIDLYNPIKKQFVEAPEYPYVVWKSLNGDKSDNINKIVSPKKALDLVNNPNKLSEFLDLEENRANFSINYNLINFATIQDKDLIIENGLDDFDKVKEKFQDLQFDSILKSWNNYRNTFRCLKF